MIRKTVDIVDVSCGLKLSETCLNNYTMAKRDAKRNLSRNNGKIVCFNCSRRLSHVGEKNGNKKYNFDERYFQFIDSEIKAYFLGMIASDGSIRKSGFEISLIAEDYLILESLRNQIAKEIPIASRKNGQMMTLSINSILMVKDLCSHLNIMPGKKDSVVTVPNIEEKLLRHFIRGYFDGDGGIRDICQDYRQWPYPECTITSISKRLREQIKEIVPFPCYNDLKGQVTWTGNNALDFMGWLYDNSCIFLNRKRDLYLDWCIWEPGLKGTSKKEALFKYVKTDINAVKPSKNRVSDSGYDLTVIKKDKEVGNLVYYDTCIKVQPVYGYYFDLVPRSSMPKTGYILANSVGIIDRTYVGSIKVCLIKIDKNMPDLELPAKIVQLIPRTITHCEFVEKSFEDTERGEKGFGSSDL